MTTLRVALGVLCGAGAAALGALILGEYEFTGTLPFIAGPLFGVAIGEIVVGVGRLRSRAIAVICGVLAFSGIAWAGRIDSTQGVEPVKGLVWVAAVLAAGVAAWRSLDLTRLRKR